MNTYSASSRKVLDTLHPDLKLVLEHVLRKHDHKLLEGRRSRATQANYVKLGVSKTMNSKHVPPPDLSEEDQKVWLSLAVDVTPYPVPEDWGKLSDILNCDPEARDRAWKARVQFYTFARSMLDTAEELGIGLRWGGDWDMDGDFLDQDFDDLVHFELIHS